MRARPYDIFISYRRAEGAAEARLVAAALAQHGVHAFLDVADLRRGRFDITLLNRVEEAPNFLVILTPGALDRCNEEGDWLRQEIAQAIKKSRNIIPLILPGFQFPATLPPDLTDLPRHQGVEYSHALFDATIARILDSVGDRPQAQRRLAGRWAVSVGLLAVAVLPAVGLVIAQARRQPHNLHVAIVPARPEVMQPSVAGVQNTSDDSLKDLQRIRYAYRREQGLIRVTYRLPYLDLVRKGGPVEGLTYDRTPFSGEVPKLLVTLLNSGPRTVVLTATVLTIKSSTIEAEPIPVFDDRSQGNLRISNQGWADNETPQLRFTISRETGEVALFAADEHILKLPTIAESQSIPLRDYIPAGATDDPILKVDGTLEYGKPGARQTLAFATHVKQDVRAGAGILPERTYDAFFKAGETGVVFADMQPAQEVKPDQTAAFLVGVRTDKSSRTRLSVGFKTVDGKMIDGQEFELEIFVPRLQTVDWKQGGVARQ
jgi:hypothetical protein